MPDLPLRRELKLHSCLIYQLDRELNYHMSEVRDLRYQPSKWMDKWSEQARELKQLKKEKLELSESLKELKKEKLELRLSCRSWRR